jgi:hypothetical protein
MRPRGMLSCTLSRSSGQCRPIRSDLRRLAEHRSRVALVHVRSMPEAHVDGGITPGPTESPGTRAKVGRTAAVAAGLAPPGSPEPVSGPDPAGLVFFTSRNA